MRCLECKKQFEPKRKKVKQKFCSAKCRVANWDKHQARKILCEYFQVEADLHDQLSKHREKLVEQFRKIIYKKPKETP